MTPLARIIANCDTDESAVRELRNRGYGSFDAWDTVKRFRAIPEPKPERVSITYVHQAVVMSAPMRKVLHRLMREEMTKTFLRETTAGLSRGDVDTAFNSLQARGWIKSGPRARWRVTDAGREALGQ